VVKVERTRGDDMVLSAGLQAGEIVVTDGQLQLEDGSRVETNPNADPAAGARP
jgi:multidrug efflux pump subunit AcrA (membrane-fusion protein)